MRVEAANSGRPRAGSASYDTGRRLWQRRRASPLSPAQLAIARLVSGWRLLLAVGVGILLAVMLMCTVPLYDALMTNVQILATINHADAAARDVEIVTTASPFSDDVRQQTNARVLADGKQYLGAFTGRTVSTYLTTDPLLLAHVGNRALDVTITSAPQVSLAAFDYAQALPHMHLLAGQLPSDNGSAGASGVYNAVITQQMAHDQGAQVGDIITGEEFGAHDRTIAIRVAGIWEPTQPNDAFWNGRSFDAGGTATTAANYPLLLDQPSLIRVISALPNLAVSQHWVYYTDPTRINTGNMDAVQNDLGLLRSRLEGDIVALGAQVAVNTSLDTNLRNVEQQLGLLTLPLYIVVAQVVGLALLFVLAMAGLLVDGQSVDVATLKSRGGSGAQLLGSYATQGVLLALLAVLIGPWLAAFLALALVRAFVPAATLTTAGATSSYLVGLSSPQAVALPAVAGALLGVAAVVAATQRASRLDVLAFRREQGRATRQPIWRRYYLDVGLAVLCGLGYLELSVVGTLGTRELLGSAASTPLLLAAPALLLLAGTLLLLRVFPVVAGAAAGWAARGRGATGMLAFAQVARSPAGPSRLMLLLALSVGLGLFALTFDSSLVHSAADRSAYQAGSDVRLVEQGAQVPGRDHAIQTQLGAMAGVRGLTPVYRNQVTTTFDEGYNTLDLLAIDPATWARVAGATSWRPDYASQPLPALMGGLQQHQRGDAASDRAGTTLAGDATHPVWAMVSDTFLAALHLRVGDHFALNLPGASGQPAFFVVGAVVHEFPTLYPAQQPAGFVVLNLNDCLGAIHVATSVQGPGVSSTPDSGPNEYWLAASADPARAAALVAAIQQGQQSLSLDHLVDRQALRTTIASNPIEAGMRGLLLVGALTAAALAVLGTIVQSALAARQRAVQFAVLRTMGMASRQLTGVLLTEQVAVYIFGLLGGTVLGTVLASATLPFLQFGDSAIDPATLGVPPYVLSINLTNLAWFYLALLLAFVVALVIAARYAATVGLGKTLRLGED